MTYSTQAGELLTYDELEALDPASEIRENLFQGSHPDSYEGFDMVVSCERYARRTPLKDFSGLFLHLPFDDTDDEHAVPWGSVETAGEAVAHAVSSGNRVLVHCTAGLNRSSLVTHQALRGLGWSAQSAVDRIRTQRSKFCLCNRTFERLCLEN